MTPRAYGCTGHVLHIPQKVHRIDHYGTQAIWRCGAAAGRALFVSIDDEFMNRYCLRCEGCFYPEIRKAKRAASKAVQDAIKAGLLEKGIVCEDCGAANNRLNGHHDDYNEPLVVRWLCPGCHRRWHWKNKAVQPRLEAVAS